MKKIITTTLGVALALSLFSACVPDEDEATVPTVPATTSDAAKDSLTASTEIGTSASDALETVGDAATTAWEEVKESAAEQEASGTVAQQNALRSAQQYVDMMGFSEAGLLDQLTSEYGSGFEQADAEWAVAHLDVDWNAEAVEAAESYLSVMGFSRAGLIEQLTSEYGSGFTLEQATYAVEQVGL